jgi:hypothetical protein
MSKPKEIELKLESKTVMVKTVHTPWRIIHGTPIFGMCKSARKQLGMSKNEAHVFVNELAELWKKDMKKKKKK